MTPVAGALFAQQMTVRQRLTDYLALDRSRASCSWSSSTTFVGYYLGSRDTLDPLPLLQRSSATRSRPAARWR